MNKETKKEFSSLLKQLKKLNLDNNKNYVVYPYGKVGKRVKKAINYLGINESFIIDNNLCKENPKIKSIDDLNDIDTSKYTFLVACTSCAFRREILEAIRKHVPESQIIDVFHYRTEKKSKLRKNYREILLTWRHKAHFLWTIRNEKGVRVMDVGCGNQSASIVKAYCNNIFYTGIDVGDYNQSTGSLNLIDDYHVVSPEKFADEIATFKGSEDYVISSHNIEHCNEPEKVVAAMCGALKQGGMLYMSFPSRESVLFPSRMGTLNFYDDAGHIYLPDFDKILRIMRKNGMKIIFKKASMRGWYFKRLGKKNEPLSIAENRVKIGTWDYWGFESIIWAKRVR